MLNSLNEDQDQRKNTSMEDSTAMTIEFLRARLLSERSVSRTARQRADDLAKRVEELEEHLKILSLQREKAEKATADVLAILENRGISDFSEEFDSSSEQEATFYESKVGNCSVKEETSADVKVRRNDVETFSGCELESSPLTGRSLSWKSNTDSPHSLERKRYMDSSRRRRSSFASTGSSSPQRVGKSCRQIRRRESRSAIEEFQIDTGMPALQGDKVATCSECFPNCSDIVSNTLGEGFENPEGKDLLEGPVSQVLENQRATNDHYFNSHGGDKDMERALQHQAQLIGRYEAEEKAQREWEEKFRENNSSTPDSCDPGNHSDVTEERDEIKTPAPLCPTGTITSGNQEAKLEAVDVSLSKESESPNGFHAPPHVNTGCLQDQKSSRIIAYDSPAPEFAFSMAKGKHDQERSDTDRYPPLHGSHDCTGSHATPGSYSAHIPSSASSRLCKAEASGNTNELALMPLETSDKLGSVLEALQQAKLSLNQNLNRLPLSSGSAGKAIEPSIPAVKSGDIMEIPVGYAGLFRLPSDQNLNRLPVVGGSAGKAIEPSVPSMKSGDGLEIAVGYAGLFRLPTDFQFEATTRANFLSSESRLSLPNYSPEPVGDKFFSGPYSESRSITTTGNRFHTIHAGPHTEIRSGVSTQSPVFGPSLDAGMPYSSRYAYLNPHLTAGLPSSGKYTHPTYPFYPDLRPRMPSTEELGISLPSKEVGIPPETQFSFYDDRTRPNMYR